VLKDINARVSSRERQQEGYSIDAQLKSLRTYAKKSGFDVVREFIDIESAKSTGRKPFGEMIDYLKPRLSGKS
jgi:DNA invertase Pin-like site-specific DNA recombinase